MTHDGATEHGENGIDIISAGESRIVSGISVLLCRTFLHRPIGEDWHLMGHDRSPFPIVAVRNIMHYIVT